MATTRFGASARLLALLVVLLGLLATPALGLPSVTGPGVGLADEGEGGGDGDGSDGGGNGGDNGGNSGHDGEDGEDGHDGEDDEDECDDWDDECPRDAEFFVQFPVAQAPIFRVEVDCVFDEPADRTICIFVGLVGQGVDSVTRIVVPHEVVCAEVVGGAFAESDEADASAPGLASTNDDGTLALMLAGEVATEGEATYWVETDALLPTTGPGLACTPPREPLDAETEPTVELTVEGETEVTAETGAIEIHSFACGAVATDKVADWYGNCAEATADVEFAIAFWDGAAFVPQGTAATDDGGAARFPELPPGTYRVTAVDAVWCHAESDSVDERGEVIVVAGEPASVWTFFCDEAGVLAPAATA
jgi:hypothetical protein